MVDKTMGPIQKLGPAGQMAGLERRRIAFLPEEFVDIFVGYLSFHLHFLYFRVKDYFFTN